MMAHSRIGMIGAGLTLVLGVQERGAAAPAAAGRRERVPDERPVEAS